ncbi:MAG: hypothetical protein RML36_15275 [Anaerolineae bacterium]|nr:hypothetical protein [Anaerolineae bacterium]
MAAQQRPAIYAPASYAPIRPDSMVEYVGHLFHPLHDVSAQTRLYYAALPGMAEKISHPYLQQATAGMREMIGQAMPMLRQAQQDVMGLAGWQPRGMEQLADRLGDVFARQPNAAAAILATVSGAGGPEGFRRTQQARELMRLMKAMGPERAMMYGLVSGMVTPGQFAAMAGPAALLGLAQAASPADAARMQALGQAIGAALPAHAQAQGQVVSQIPGAMAAMTSMPFQTAPAYAQANLQAAQLAQMPYVTALQTSPQAIQAWLSAAAAPALTAADMLRQHQVAAIQSLPEMMAMVNPDVRRALPWIQQ